jgi:ribosomal protein S18 acetylase RimI-like enzyme
VKGYSFFVYEGSKGVIGDLFVHPAHSSQGQYSIEERLLGHVTQVCVAPEYRGRGLGKALICMACSELQKRGCHALSLTVTEGNAPAVNLYKRMGFAIHRIFDAFVWEG